jgi:zinc transport system substrate-binding protein
MRYTRRELLASAAGTGAMGLSGCLSNQATDDEDGENSENNTTFTAQVSFPVIYDFTANTVPEGVEAENLVPVGQHGHGWSPSPDIQRSVTTSDAFVYVFEGFQPWADDMITNLERDHPDVAIVEAGADVELLEVGEVGHGHGKDSGDEDHGSGEESDEHNDGHDHSNSTNPHFWLDPLRAKTAVNTVADGLAEAHGEEGYAENARAYGSRLDNLHEDLKSSLADASKDTVLVAGHNAFAYLGERYGFRVETLTGIAPDEQPSPQDIRRAQELIDEEGIEYVLSPVFESDRAARSLVNDTTATEVLPITAFAGFSQEWLENDWGYVEVMRNVNLSSLERALEA